MHIDKQWRKSVGCQRSKFEIIPLGIPVFPELRRTPSGPKSPTVVYLGRLENRKGTIDLLKAIPLVLRRIPDARFVLIGSDRPHCPGGRIPLLNFWPTSFPPKCDVGYRCSVACRSPRSTAGSRPPTSSSLRRFMNRSG